MDEFIDIAKPRLKDIVPKRKNKKIVIASIALIIVAGVVFAYSESKSNEPEKYKNNTSLGENKKQASNVDENNPDVKKAIQKLYDVTKDSKAYTVYELNNGDSYVQDPRIKKNYYIFNISNPEGYLADFNYAVNKNDYGVYVCTVGGLVIPYKDYNTDTKLGKYYTDYEMMGDSNIPETTKNYLEKNGAEALNVKVNEIMKDALPATIEHCNGPVLYVDAILRGAKKQELDEEVFVYTESEYNVDTFLNSMFKEYERAVAVGDPSIMYPYVTPDGESHKKYSETIPKYHEKGITVKLLDNEISGRKVDSNGDCIITATTDFEITNKNGTKTQKEKADYVIKRISNTEFELDRIENWSIVK